jgi:hypothetical protein
LRCVVDDGEVMDEAGVVVWCGDDDGEVMVVVWVVVVMCRRRRRREVMVVVAVRRRRRRRRLVGGGGGGRKGEGGRGVEVENQRRVSFFVCLFGVDHVTFLV